MAYLLIWTTFWPLLGGVGCLSQRVTFPTNDVTTEAPKLSLFIQSEARESLQNNTDNNYLQTFTHKILNGAHNSRNNTIQRRAKSDLRTRPREGRGKLEDSDNIISSNNNIDKYSRVNADAKEHATTQEQANFIYSSFYENHPLIQKLTDPRPQTFLSGDSHVVAEELASMFSPDKGIPLPNPGSTNSVSETEWSPAWYTSLYEAGKNFNSAQSNAQQHNESKQKAEGHSPEISFSPKKLPPDNEYKESGYFATAAPVPTSSTSTGSSFNVGYSIGVSNNQAHRGTRTIIKPYTEQKAEAQGSQAYSSALQRPSSQGSGSGRSPEVITGKPEQGPYRYELLGENSVWKHLTPNIEMSLSTTAKPEQYSAYEPLPKPQRLNQIETEKPPTNGHTTPSTGQAFYFYTGKGGENSGNAGPGSFDHNHALGQSNIFDFSNAMTGLPGNLVASSAASKQTADKGYVSVAQHIQRENKKFEDQLKNMLEGKGKISKTVLDNAIAAAQIPKPRNVSQTVKPKRANLEAQYSVLKNSIQSVIIPLPNGKNVHMPAIVIPLGPVPAVGNNHLGGSPVVVHTGKPSGVAANPLGIQVHSPSGLHAAQTPVVHAPNPIYAPQTHLTQTSGVFAANPYGSHVSHPSSAHWPNPPGTHVSHPSGVHASNTVHVSNHPETYLIHPSGVQVSSSSVVHASHPLGVHVTSSPTFSVPTQPEIYVTNPPEVYAPTPAGLAYTSESVRFDVTKQHNKGAAARGKPRQVRPQATNPVKQQARVKKPPVPKPIYSETPEEAHFIHTMPKYNRVQPTEYTPTANSYVYYSMNDGSVPKPQYHQVEHPLVAAGTDFLNAVLLPFDRDSTEVDLNTEATEYDPGTFFSNKLKYDPPLSQYDLATLPSDEGTGTTVQPVTPGLSSQSHRKRKVKTKKRKKTGSNSTSSASSGFSQQAQNTAVAATMVEPEHQYGYGLVPIDDAYASLMQSFPTTGSHTNYHSSTNQHTQEHPQDQREYPQDQREHPRNPWKYSRENSWKHLRDQQEQFQGHPRENNFDEQQPFEFERRPAHGHLRYSSHHRQDGIPAESSDSYALGVADEDYFRYPSPQMRMLRRVRHNRDPPYRPSFNQKPLIRRRIIWD